MTKKFIDYSKLNIEIAYQKQIDLVIEFPLEIIRKYKGLDNLDETLDDDIFPIIKHSIIENNAYIKKTDLNVIRAKNIDEEKISYALSLIVNPPNFNLACIVINLTKEKLQKGLRINRILKNEKIDTLYLDIYYSSK